MIAYLLSSSPKNGVELMDGVESITRGWWRPTPGSIYPLLKEMTDQGVVKKLDDGRYELTQKGRTQMQIPFRRRPRGARTVDEMVGQIQGYVSYMEGTKGDDRPDLARHAADLRNLARRLNELAEEGRTGGEAQP